MRNVKSVGVSMIRRIGFWYLLLLLCCGGVMAQPEKRLPAETRGVRAYDMRITGILPDTVAVHDSAVVTVEMYLDCTNRITRTEVRADTADNGRRIVLAVYGTFIEGPRRPLCAARRVVKDLTVGFPSPGDWIVEASPAAAGGRPVKRWVVAVR